jgi:hypothetical protein
MINHIFYIGDYYANKNVQFMVKNNCSWHDFLLNNIHNSCQFIYD